MKRAFALFGLIGLVGCFLPLVPGFSLFDARAFDWTSPAASCTPCWSPSIGAVDSLRSADLTYVSGYWPRRRPRRASPSGNSESSGRRPTSS